jgi:ATP-dependent RNA helicase DDX54/DBP10
MTLAYVKVGARAIVLAPSRELALQTLKVVKEMGRGTDLRTTVLVGGDSLEDQFGNIMANPDMYNQPPVLDWLTLLVSLQLQDDSYI